MAEPKPGEQAIFNVARRIEDPDARRQYLEQACEEDRGLRARIEALLRAHDEGSTFLQSPAEAFRAGFAEPVSEALGTVIGPYQLRQQIGEGGMGTVFLAEQAQPVQRTVALKIIAPGLDSCQVIARFEAERQALALMDHPNIAKVLDAGTTQTGRPYFVMELIKGVPITRYCDEHRLTPRQRLELFVPVCQGVQHAHQKGIIHRDLKPSNVLVGVYDGQPVPRIIDFGVAKATGQKLTERTLVTEIGAVVGTLDYMSPEQASPNQFDIDTRSDIYALGALLYELLTGTTPLHRERRENADLWELLRLIREEEPPRPSLRLSTTEELPAIAANRGVEPKKLSGLVRGDLDWIVMKCLEKDRTRRYETANGLARDLERYLRDEPVEASPPGAGYRLRKFARRHRKVLATAAAFVLLLFVGAVVSAWQAVRATAAERQARDNERQALAERDAKEEARQAEAEQRQQAVAEKQRADEEAAVARAVEDFLQNDLLGQADIGNQAARGARNRNITVRELLDRAAERIDTRFRGQERTEAAVRLTLGKAYHALGEHAEAQRHLERSQSLHRQKLGEAHPDTLKSMNSLGLLYRSRGLYDEARPLFEKVVEHRRIRLGPDHRDTLIGMHNLGMIYRDLSRYDDAESLYTQVVEIHRAKRGADHPDTLFALHHLALLHLSRGRFQAAEPLLKQVVAGMRAAGGPDHPVTLTCTSNLASCYMELHRYDEAEPLYRQVLEAHRDKHGPDHPATLFSMNLVGQVHLARKRYEEAEPLFRHVLQARRDKLGADHPDTLTSMSSLAIVLQARSQYDEAEALFQQALDGRRTKLGSEDPDTLRSLNNLAALYRDLGRYADAEPLFRAAGTGAKKKLGLNHPQTQLYINNLADLQSKLAQPALAEPELRELADFLRKNAGTDSPAYAGQLGRLAQNFLQQKKHAEAETVARDALSILSRKEPDVWSTFHTQSLVGAALLGQEKYADAEALLVQGYAGMKERAAKIPTDARDRLTQALERLVQLHDTLGNTTEADRLRKALEDEKTGQKR